MVDQPANAKATEPPAIRGKDYGIIFSNYSRMRVSATEFALTFAYLDTIPVAGAPMDTQGTPYVEDRAVIVLTPHHAKQLAQALQGAVTAYEREYGAIKLDLLPPIGPEKITAAVKELTGD